MKLVIDESITFAEEAFSQFGDVILIPGRSINNNILLDADALIVRSITIVNEKLLKGTPVKFVGTATIGTDHIDIEYLNKNGIGFSSAAGCNSYAVAEYVLTALSKIIFERGLKFNELTIGIVGAGNIGSKLVNYCTLLGMKVLKNDPPLKRKTKDKEFLELNELMKADIITLHVPLNMEEDRTYHLFDRERLEKIKQGTIIFNTSRGPVIENNALLSLIDKKNFTVILDVWEDEPDINIELLKKSFIASPHIAGYSLEGKVNGTTMIYNSLCNFLKRERKWKPSLPHVENSNIAWGDESGTLEQMLYSSTSKIYKIDKEKIQMLKMIDMQSGKKKSYFDSLRKNYDLRREFNNYTLKIENKKFTEIFKKLRFNAH